MFSLSCPSEPPGVGIWFSSYEYRSPDPDSNFSPHDSVFGEKEFRRDEEEEEEEKVRVRGDGVPGEKVVQCNRTCVIEDDHNEDLCLTKNQNLQPFSSCSLFSEPPDIRNWFSSYVYESPESDTGSLFRDEVSEEKEVLDFEVVQNESRSENVNSKRCVDINTSSSKNPKGDDGTKMKKNSSTADSLHPEKTLQPFVQNKTLQHNPSPSNCNGTLSLNHESPGCVQEGHLISFDTDRSAMRPPKLAEKNGTRESKSKTEIQNDKLDSSTSLAKIFSTTSSHGFVTRKNSSTCSNDENSWKKPEKIILKCSTSVGKSSITCEKDGVTKRKALAEATNLEQYNVVGITGKWQCPQKRKPDVGPAMKQLRLERWVRRI